MNPTPKEPRIRFAREGWPFVLPMLGLTFLAGWWLGTAAWWVGGLLTLGTLLFFRDPRRVVTAGANEILSGADGLVRSVELLDEPAFEGGKSVRISVFLSIFDVHINRSPLAGEVQSVHYEPGKHLLAYLDSASEYNEHSTVEIAGERVDARVRQIVGPVARRVVCWLKPGEHVGAGQRLGIMKFGSRLDVELPASRVRVLVRKGDRVRAGQTVMAVVNEE